MDFPQYNERVYKYASHKHIDCPVMGLVEEIGELTGHIARYQRMCQLSSEEVLQEVRDPQGAIATQLRDKIIKEMGDILMNLNTLAQDINTSLDVIATINANKLDDRASRGVLNGDGDYR